jgi:DME family drug/metabolite transporter
VFWAGRKTRAVGAAAIVVAAASWGTIGLAKSFLPAGTDPVAVACARVLVGGLALAGCAVRPVSVRATVTCGRRLGSLAASSCAMACYQIAFFVAIAQAGPAIAAAVTLGSVPLFSGLLSRRTGLPLSSRWWGQATFAVVGCVLLGMHGLRLGGQVLVGVGCAVVAGLLYAIFTLVVAGVLQAGSPATATMGLVFAGAGVSRH